MTFVLVEKRDAFILSKSDEKRKINLYGRVLLPESTTERNCIHSQIDQFFQRINHK